MARVVFGLAYKGVRELSWKINLVSESSKIVGKKSKKKEWGHRKS